MGLSHTALVIRAHRLLKGTFNCRVIFCELVAFTKSGETPDAIGWVNNRSILIECKTSRADFKADQKKRSRIKGMAALGSWRFYLAEPGVIDPEELPDGWGLYEIRGKRIFHAGGMKHSAVPPPFASDRDSEVAMLLSALRRKED